MTEILVPLEAVKKEINEWYMLNQEYVYGEICLKELLSRISKLGEKE
jgi:hypothetical protein